MNTKSTYEKEILKVIQDNNLFVITDIFAFYTGIKSSQFYNLKLEKSDILKNAIDDNKKKTCQSLKNKWFHSDNPTLQIALFKTISSESDLRKLAQSYQENTGEMKITWNEEKSYDNEKKE